MPYINYDNYISSLYYVATLSYLCNWYLTTLCGDCLRFAYCKLRQSCATLSQGSTGPVSILVNKCEYYINSQLVSFQICNVVAYSTVATIVYHSDVWSALSVVLWPGTRNVPSLHRAIRHLWEWWTASHGASWPVNCVLIAGRSQDAEVTDGVLWYSVYSV